jgi:hypothetical protein
LPSVDRLYRDLGARGLEVRLVSFREDSGPVTRVARERGYAAPVLLDRSGDLAGRVYGVFGPPTVYLIDREGRLVARGIGPQDWASPAARQVLEALLAEPAPG